MDSCERPSKIRKIAGDAPVQRDVSLQGLSTDAQQLPSESGPVGTSNTVNDAFEDGHVVVNGDLSDISNDADESILPGDAIAPLANSLDTSQETQGLSKNQLKKLRKKAEWEAKRPERKAIRKEKQAAKRDRKRAAKQSLDPAERPEPKKQSTQRAVQLPITIVIDCDFDNLMNDSERMSLGAQITRCYSDNKNSKYRAHLTICSFGGKLKERFDTVLDHYKSWRGVRTLDDNFVSTAEKAKEWMTAGQGGQMAGMFSKFADLDGEAQVKLKEAGEIIYLSSEADEDLTELKPYSTYIIGGIVDKNREKGICHKRATQAGIKTARLPIGEFMEMQSRKVLATNHVNEIMMKWLECGDWGTAFLQVIPKRKGGKLKSVSAEDDDAEEEMAATTEEPESSRSAKEHEEEAAIPITNGPSDQEFRS